MEPSTPENQNVKKVILVVDDDPTVLEFVSGVLADRYTVLTAENGAAALKQSREREGDIDLLLSDFVMPGMNGIELATAMTQERPKLRVLLMSGFTGGMLVLNEGWHFLPKPFIPSQLRALIVGLIFPETKNRF